MWRIGRVQAGMLVAAAVFAAAGARYWLRPGVDPDVTAVVRRGSLTARLSATGTLRPIQSRTYHSPVVGREVEVVELAPEGTRVNEGDLLVRLSTTDVDVEIERVRQEYRQAELDLDVAIAEYDEAQATVLSVAEGEGALTAAEVRSRLQVAERKAGRLRQEYAQLEPLMAKGVITADELGRTASAFEQAEEELSLARKRAEVMERLTRPREVTRAELQRAQKDAQLGRARARVAETETRLAALDALLKSCRLYAQGGGLVVYEEFLNTSPRRKIRVGDRVTSSQGLVTIPEVTRMLVDASVSEVEVHRVRPGQRAEVRVEAFADLRLTGSVVRVGTLASSSAFRPLDDKRFDLIIALDPTEVELRPEMPARAEIEIASRENVLLLPVNAIFEERGAFVVHVVDGGRFETRQVTLGESNDQFVEVLTALREGDRVLLAGPRASADRGQRQPIAATPQPANALQPR